MNPARSLKISIGQHSDMGRKKVNQDFHGVLVPREPLLSSKGIAIALADGIGSSDVSQSASEFAVMGVLDDYYCTSEAWSVKKSVEQVLRQPIPGCILGRSRVTTATSRTGAMSAP